MEGTCLQTWRFGGVGTTTGTDDRDADALRGPQWNVMEDRVHDGVVPPSQRLHAPSWQLDGESAELSRPPIPKAAVGLAVAFLASGTLHLVRPAVFRALIPPGLPATDAWIYGSGVAELGCAAGLLTRQRWAPLATAAVLSAVWPGNIWYAIAVQRSSRTSTVAKAVAWARVPLQLPMIGAALSVGRSSVGAPR